MKRIFLAVCVAALVISNPVRALDNHDSAHNKNDSVTDFIINLKWNNFLYYSKHKGGFFAEMAKGESPIATVVACSDSRVQTNMLDPAPEGKLFMVRNIGNQLATAEGSVEYGIRHLHTPVLLFIGHSRCGAIAAVGGNYSKESPAIKRELDSIAIGTDLNNIDGVKANVNNQVAAAMLKFEDELKKKKLTVIGAVLDFADDLHQGTGKLSIINVNGETNSANLAKIGSVLTKAKTAKPASK